MSEWLLHCADDLKSGAYYASVDICDGEQPTFILFKKDGEKTFVVGQGEPVNPHSRLIEADALYEDCALDHDYEVMATTTRINEYMQLKIDGAPTIIPASEGRL